MGVAPLNAATLASLLFHLKTLYNSFIVPLSLLLFPSSPEWQHYCLVLLHHLWSHSTFCEDSPHFSIGLSPTEGRGVVFFIIFFLVVVHTLSLACGAFASSFSLYNPPTFFRYRFSTQRYITSKPLYLTHFCNEHLPHMPYHM